jgi:hypothetical protein
MNNIQVNNLMMESFSELINLKNHYYQMLEKLKVTMLDGSCSIPVTSKDLKYDYEEKIDTIERAIDRKLSALKNPINRTPSN